MGFITTCVTFLTVLMVIFLSTHAVRARIERLPVMIAYGESKGQNSLHFYPEASLRGTVNDDVQRETGNFGKTRRLFRRRNFAYWPSVHHSRRASISNPWPSKRGDSLMVAQYDGINGFNKSPSVVQLPSPTPSPAQEPSSAVTERSIRATTQTARTSEPQPKISRGDIAVNEKAEEDYSYDDEDNRGGPSPLSGRHAVMQNPSITSASPDGHSSEEPFKRQQHHQDDSNDATPFQQKTPPSMTNQQPMATNPSQSSTVAMTIGSVAGAVVILIGAAAAWRKRKASRNSLKVVLPPKIMIKSPSTPNMTANGIPFVLPYVSIPPLRQSCMSDDETSSSKKNRQNRNRRVGIAHLQPPAIVNSDYDNVVSPNLTSSSIGQRVSTCSRDFLTVDRYYDRNLFECYPLGMSEDDQALGDNNTNINSGIPHSDSANSIGVGFGRIGFTLAYCFESEELKIFIIGASSLPAKAKKGSVDPFLRVTLIPDKHPKFSTKIKRNSLSPSFEEEFVFPLRKNYLDGKMLKLKICDYDKFSRKMVIGYVVFPLKDAGITNGISGDTRTAEIWRDIQETVEFDPVRVSFGEVLLCLKYDPNSGLLSIDIIQAQELKFQKESTASLSGDSESSSSVYAKVVLYEGKRVIKSKKTDVRKNTRDPIFNENFSIHVPRSYLSDIYADISLWHKGRLGRKKMIGKTQVGPFTYVSGTGLEQWEDMLHQPNTKVSQWHSLHQ